MIEELNLGDIYMDENKKLWKVVSYCDQPTVTLQAIEADPLPNPRFHQFAQQMQPAQSIPAPATLPHTFQKQSAAFRASIWDGFRRIFKNAEKA